LDSFTTNIPCFKPSLQGIADSHIHSVDTPGFGNAPIIDEVKTRNTLLPQKAMNILGLKFRQTMPGRILYAGPEEDVAGQKQSIPVDGIRSKLKQQRPLPTEHKLLMNDDKKGSECLQCANEDLDTKRVSVMESMSISIDWNRSR